MLQALRFLRRLPTSEWTLMELKASICKALSTAIDCSLLALATAMVRLGSIAARAVTTGLLRSTLPVLHGS